MLKLKDWVFSFCVIAASTVALFIGLNVFCAWLFLQFPSLLHTPAERIAQEANERIRNSRSANAVKWLALNDENELDAYCRELDRKTDESGAGNRLTRLSYQDYTHFKSRPAKGRFFNFNEAAVPAAAPAWGAWERAGVHVPACTQLAKADSASVGQPTETCSEPA